MSDLQAVNSLDDICTFNEAKRHHPDSVLMRMLKKALFICSHAGCAESLQLEKINQHEINECKQWRIHCPANRCSFVSRVEHVIIHSVQCPFHIFYCGPCKISYNDLVWKHECHISKVIQVRYSKHKRSSRYRQSPPTYLHGNVILTKHSYKNSFEFYNQTRPDKFISQARNFSSPFSFLLIFSLSGRPSRILQRQHTIIEDGVQSSIQPQRLQKHLQRLNETEDLATILILINLFFLYYHFNESNEYYNTWFCFCKKFISECWIYLI